MARTRLFVFAALLCLPPAFPARADAPGEARRVLQSAYAAMDAGLGRKDTEAAFTFYAPACVFVTRGGKQRTLENEQDSIMAVIDTLQTVRSDTRIITLTLAGDGATVTASHHITATGIGRKTHRPARLDSYETRREFWEKGDEGWRVKRSRALTERLTFNGKRVPDK